MVFANERITILYGSQTGNAQDVAELIWRESKRYFFTGFVKSMDDYNILELIHERCVIFVCSTTGQGEEPDNMKHFWRFLLRKNLPNDSLCNTRFSVLGLGDSSYVKFNFVAKRLHKRLIQLGGQMMVSLGLGDSQHDLGYDAAVDPWIDNLWKSMLFVYPLPNGITALDRHSYIKPRWTVLFSTEEAVNVQPQSIYYSVRTPHAFEVIVKENKRTTSETHFQDVRLIKFETNGEIYNPGDVIVFRPKNSPSQVEAFITVLESNGVHISSETLVKISEVNSEMPVPAPLKNEVTFRQLFEEYFDLTAIPRRHTFQILAQLTDSELEKEKCIEFTTAEGQEDLYNYCNRPKRNITEVLQDFPHAVKNLTKEMLFEILQPIKPREFSIASSCKTHINEVHILIAVVKYKTKLLKERLGLATTYLAYLKPGHKLTTWIKPGSFKFPKNPNGPVIMVGPGTGLAPFRNYIFERDAENTASSQNLILFFGCRSYNSDFHSREELLKLHSENKLNLICAFSRDQEQKIYVQHKIRENMQIVWAALKTGEAYILVAGNSKNMPQAVKDAFEEVCVQAGAMSKEEAVTFIQDMEIKNQYQTETWS